MSEDTSFLAAEADTLPVHVAACAERYKTLFNRLNRIERILVAVAGGVFAMLATIAGGVLIELINRGLEK